MASDQIKWMAKKLFSLLEGEARQNFLKSLKYDRDFVVRVFAQDVEGLMMEYTMSEHKATFVNVDKGDQNVFITCAKNIAEYMHEEMLKDELAQIE